MPDTQYDAGDPVQISDAARELQRRDAEDNETIRVWMNHPKGRDLLYRIVFDVCHTARTRYEVDVNGQSDTHRTYLDLGERNIGAWFDERLKRHPDLYMAMLKEQEIERDARQSRIAKRNAEQDQS